MAQPYAEMAARPCNQSVIPTQMAQKVLQGVPMGSQCVFYKYKIPTEIRNSIFIQAAYNNFEEAYRYDNGVVGWSSETPTRAQELDYPPTKYDWTKLLEPGIDPPNLLVDTFLHLSPLEQAFIYDNKQLFLECVKARFSVSVLAIKANIDGSSENASVSHALFGEDIPPHFLDYFNHIRYQACDRELRYPIFGINNIRNDVDWCYLSFESLQKCIPNFVEAWRKRFGQRSTSKFVLELAGDWAYADLADVWSVNGALDTRSLGVLGDGPSCHFKRIDTVCKEFGLYKANVDGTVGKLFVDSNRQVAPWERNRLDIKYPFAGWDDYIAGYRFPEEDFEISDWGLVKLFSEERNEDEVQA